MNRSHNHYFCACVRVFGRSMRSSAWGVAGQSDGSAGRAEMKKVAVLLALALSVGCAAAYVSSCDPNVARNDCGK